MSEGVIQGTFVKDYNDFTRSWGWRPIENEKFDAVNGLMACHDLMEHFPNSGVAPVADEFMAIGAAYFLRVEPGFFDSDPFSDSEDEYDLTKDFITPAFSMLFHHIVDENLETPYAPNITAAGVSLGFALEEDIRDAIRIAAQIIAPEFISRYGQYGSKDSMQAIYRWNKITHAIGIAMEWIRIGYRKAAERYCGLLRIRLSEMYRMAAQEMTELLKRAEPGEAVTLTFLPDSYRHTCDFRPILAQPREEPATKKEEICR